MEQEQPVTRKTISHASHTMAAIDRLVHYDNGMSYQSDSSARALEKACDTQEPVEL